MIFEQIRIGGDRNFSYLIGDTEEKRGCIIDPAFNPDKALKHAENLGLTIELLINTHSHFDHSSGNDYILRHTDAKLLHGGKGGIGDGEIHTIGNIRFTFIHTPGHTSDSICILTEEEDEPKRLVTGDTLFVGKVGGTDFDNGARDEYVSLHEKIMTLPDDVEIWPGHDYGIKPYSTVGYERNTNPFLLCESFEDFVYLKKNWLQYKKDHGIT